MSTTYYVTTTVDQLGERYITDRPDGQMVGASSTIAEDIPTLEEACRIVTEHVIPGKRGPGCFDIYETDGNVRVPAFEQGLLGP